MRRPACKNLKNLERQFNECLVCNVFHFFGSFQSHRQSKAGKFHTIIATPYSEARVSFWKRRTSQPFEYSIDGIDAINTKHVNCHYCISIVDGGKPIHRLSGVFNTKVLHQSL